MRLAVEPTISMAEKIFFTGLNLALFIGK